MSDYKSIYERWISSEVTDKAAKDELLSIKDDEKEIEERFYRELEFGTAGMRGILGMGTNRMNIYTVRRASQGVAKYVNGRGADAAAKGVLIGYDTRNFSREFAEETAKVLTKNGIKVYLFNAVHSVPEVSFGIRTLGTAAGVMITASHNPKEYNGYKVYGPDGGQLPPEAADVVVEAINSYDIFDDIEVFSKEEMEKSGLLEIVGPKLDEQFLDAISVQQLNPDAVKAVSDTFKFVYTPFHGTGSRPVQAILKKMGFKNVLVVKEQDNEDGDFPTVKSPNPEDKEGFEIAINLAKENGVDVIIGTDPDCDRVGIVVRDAEGVYRTLTGNQTGALLCEYILSSKAAKGMLSDKSVIIKTIVTTELAAAIAKNYNVEIMNVLTGFKYIGEKMTEFAETGSHEYVFGFEESYGYLAGTHARDKDGVVAVMLIAEMAAFYKTKGKSLYEALQDIYKKYGYFAEKTVSITMPGKDGMEKMAALLSGLRENAPVSVCGMDVVRVTDYKSGEIKEKDGRISAVEGLPKSDVLKYNLSDGKTYFIVRPSGTEPKIKIYLGTAGNSFDDASEIIEKVLSDVKKQMGV
ncbi:MAG: phospho-sugar mutase [Oscillospiraceae bacterium]|nr:phospho-sugar mutase [Oscillospiraceae bacterium]